MLQSGTGQFGDATKMRAQYLPSVGLGMAKGRVLRPSSRWAFISRCDEAACAPTVRQSGGRGGVGAGVFP